LKGAEEIKICALNLIVLYSQSLCQTKSILRTSFFTTDLR
jgi:hypothetical protein